VSEQPSPKRLVISDVDGTLLDPNKELTEAARAAIRDLDGAGVGFTFVSARPPRALLPLAEATELKLPFACFNGAMICAPDLRVLSQTLMPCDDVERAAEIIVEHGLDVWAFVGTEWWVTNPHGAHTEGHRKLLGRKPLSMASMLAKCREAAKVVGVSDDYDAVARCERALRESGLQISATRSSNYYVDVTNAEANKGHAARELMRLCGATPETTVTLGDMPTDVLMFRETAGSIAMGNASAEVKHAAKAVTASNSEEGFARAVREIILSSSR
jgi:Cof subfamily protein (haloacid dehalogenase superfamily)